MAQDCASLEAPISAPPKGKLVKLTSDPRKAPPNIPCLQRAKSVLEQNGIVALPTDTIYGLAGLAQSTEAIKSIYNIKERHNEKPLSICVGSISDIKNWAHVSCTEALLQDLLPGPVTLLFKRKLHLNPDLNPGVASIGIRIPDHEFVRQLVLLLSQPLALTSANTSAAQSTLEVEEFEYLWPNIDLIVDGGRISEDDGTMVPKKRKHSKKSVAEKSGVSSSREGSTVVDLSVEGKFRILRQGSALEQTLDVLKNVHQLVEVD